MIDSEAVGKPPTENFPIYRRLKMKLVNFRSFAELIQQHVQRLMGRKATIKTLAIAIKRSSDSSKN